MGDLRVEAIQHPGDTVRFVKSWWNVYRDDPHWVPPLLFERKQFFHPDKNPYFRVAHIQCFIAYRGSMPVGTIAATVDHCYQEHAPGVGFFGFFEFVDDPDVARSLFEAAAGWLRGEGMTTAIGPFNLNTNHEFGLLVDGFDSDPYVANPHNSAYFPAIYEKLGLEQVMDWYAYRIDPFGPEAMRMERLAGRLLSRHPEVKIRNLDMKHFEDDVSQLHAIYDDAWEHNWGHVRVSRDEFLFLARGFKTIIDPSLCFVVEIDGEMVAASVTLPDFNRIVKKLDGRLLPFGWARILLGRRKIDAIRVFMLGVRQSYQHLPLGAPLYWRTWQRAQELGMREAEASLILDSNVRMRGALDRMGEVYKTYRTYQADLANFGARGSRESRLLPGTSGV